jgi:membrane associated rhomboid family serine protease
MAAPTKTETLTGEFKLHAILLGGALAVMWILEIADLLIFGGGLDAYGIRPRSIEGLSGILLAPFLHGGFIHLAGNSIPFLIFGSLVLFHEIKDFVVTSALAILVGGLGAWLLGGAGTVHIGASGIGAIILSLVLAVSYGWMLFGLLPFQSGAISWQGHLFGFLGGALSAYLLRGPDAAPKRGSRAV